MKRITTAEQWQKKLAANVTMIHFMAELVPRYKADTMHDLWDSLGAMVQRYGDVFVADCINQNKAEAELALFRYGRQEVL